jgi:hypothetical protein
MLGFDRFEGGKMRRRRHTPEKIIAKLREAEVALSQGAKVAEVCPKLDAGQPDPEGSAVESYGIGPD